MISATKIIKHPENLISRRPITAQIQMCNFCNNACEYCRYVGIPVKEQKSVSYEEFIQWVPRLLALGVKGIILTGGEPTISKDFDKITSWLEASEIPYGINTNFNVYKEIKPVYLKVSLDGWSRQSYLDDRKVDKYEETLENIKKYVEWKKTNNVNTTVGIQKVGGDADECVAFYLAHSGLNVDYFGFRPMETVGHEYYQTHDEKSVIRALERLRETDKRIHINYKYREVRTCFDRCWGNFLQITVNPCGNVIYCCSKSNEVVGNLMDNDILERLAKWQTNMATCPVPCRMTGPNDLVRYMETKATDDVFI